MEPIRVRYSGRGCVDIYIFFFRFPVSISSSVTAIRIDALTQIGFYAIIFIIYLRESIFRLLIRDVLFRLWRHRFRVIFFIPFFDTFRVPIGD